MQGLPPKVCDDEPQQQLAAAAAAAARMHGVVACTAPAWPHGMLHQTLTPLPAVAGATGPAVRLWAVPGKVAQLRAAHAAATAALRFFTQWTGIEQPLRKVGRAWDSARHACALLAACWPCPRHARRGCRLPVQ